MEEPAAARRGSGARWLRLDRGLLLLVVLYVLTLPLMTHDIRASDEIEYFVYVRSLAFDGDLDFTNEYQHFYDRSPRKYGCAPDAPPGCKKFKETFLDPLTPTGKRPNFGPIGMSILWAPFFGLGHLAALGAGALGYPVRADGYTKPYLWAITFGSAFYALAGLLLAYRLCRDFASPRASFWATLTIWLGTPVIFYSHLAPGYAHAGSLFAISLLLFLWNRCRDDYAALGRWALVGLAGGLAGMVREQDALFLIVPAVYTGLGLLPWLRQRAWGEIARRVRAVALMGVAAVITFLPQVLTYRVLNGNGQPNQDVSDKLRLIPRYFWLVVFNPAHGLLFWSPIVLGALVGLALLIRRHPRLGLALLAGFILTWYINGAFKTWSTAGSFGARRFLNCTPIFVVGLGVAYDALLRTRARALMPVLSLLAIWWNASLIVQFVMEYMSRQAMTWPLVLWNQFAVVPVKLPGIVWRLLTDRRSFYQP